MKKILLFSLLAIMIILSACDSTEIIIGNEIRGRVVDQNNNNIEGVTLLAEHDYFSNIFAKSASDGRFAFPMVEQSIYYLTGRGGKEAPYMIKPRNVTVGTQQVRNIDNVQAYKMWGIGVLQQSEKSEIQAQTIDNSNLWQGIPIPEIIPAQNKGINILENNSQSDIPEYPTYILLTWELLEDTNYNDYTIYYIDDNNQENELSVDYSNIEEDIVTVVLYLTGALDDYWEEDINEFTFKIEAENGTTEQLPIITVPWQKEITQFPEISYNENDGTISWNAIDGADDYKVLIYDDSNKQIGKTEGITTTSFTLPALAPGYYRIVVDAQRNDPFLSEGTRKWPVEIGRGIIGIDTSETASTDATLSDLKVNGVKVEDFDPNVKNYNVEFSQMITEAEVTAIPNDSNAQVEIFPAPELPGTTTIIVTAEDGETFKTYNIEFKFLDGLEFVYELDIMGNEVFNAYDEIVEQLEMVNDTMVDVVEPYVQSFSLKISYATMLLSVWYDNINQPGVYDWQGDELVEISSNPLDPDQEDAWTWDFTLNDVMLPNTGNSILIEMTNASEIIDYDGGDVTITESATAEFSVNLTITQGGQNYSMEISSLTLTDFDDIYADIENVDLSNFALSIDGIINDDLLIGINGVACQALGTNIPITGTIITEDNVIRIEDFNYGDQNTSINLHLAEFSLELKENLPSNPEEGRSFDYQKIKLNEGFIIVDDIEIVLDEYNSKASFMTDAEGRLLPEEIILKGSYIDNVSGVNINGIITADFNYDKYIDLSLASSEDNFIAAELSIEDASFLGSEVLTEIEYARLYVHKDSAGDIAYNNHYGTFKYTEGIKISVRFNETNDTALDGVVGNSIKFEAISCDSTYKLDMLVGITGTPDGDQPLGSLMKNETEQLANVYYNDLELKVYFINQPKPVVSLWTLTALRGLGLIN